MAGIGLGDISQTPGSPINAIYPLVSFGLVSEPIPAGGSVYLKHSTNAGNEPGSDNWLVGVHSVLSYYLTLGVTSHATLIVELTFNEGESFLEYQPYALLPGANPLHGVRLPGWLAKFKLVNASPSVVTGVAGVIKLEAL